MPGTRARVFVSSCASTLLILGARPAAAQAVLTVPPRFDPRAPETPISPPPPSRPVTPPPVILPSGTALPPAFLPPPPPASAADPSMTWVTLPNLGLEARVEALGASSRRGPDENPEDDEEAWKPVCVEPCGTWVPSSTRLRVNGKFGVSRPFTLPAGPRVHLAVNPGRYDMRRAGIIVMSASAFAPAVTGMWFLVNHLGFPASNDEERRQDEARQAKALDVFKVGVLIGGIGIATGATLLLTNIRTTVTPQASGPAGAAAVSTPPRVSIGRGFWLSPSGVQF